MISGYATAQGTGRYASHHNGLRFNHLPGLDLQISPAGFGTYRVSHEVAGHRTALRQALLSGINLIDTSSNYTDGASETLVGQVLDELIEGHQLERDQVVLVSKAGYIQGENYQLSQERRRQGQPFPDLVEFADGLEHCIHPEFLEDQLTRSLQRLNLDTVDVYLLHNPEYFLSWAHRTGMDLVEARTEYRRRLELAFAHLEKEVAAGRIRAYGVSSNTFPNAANDPEFTSLAMLCQVANEVANDPAFHLIQLPFNLLEPEAATRANQPGEETVLAYAAARELAVLTNRPLNAIVGNSLIRLADMPEVAAPSETSIDQRVAALAGAETQLRQELLPALGLDQEAQKGIAEVLNAGHILQTRWAGFGSWHNWRDVQDRFLIPRIQRGLQFLGAQAGQNDALREWLNQYVDGINASMQAVAAHYQARAAARALALKRDVTAAAAQWEAATLSQSAIRAVRSTQGVTSVLVGMRDVRYVADVVAELYRPVEQAPRRASWQKLAELAVAADD